MSFKNIRIQITGNAAYKYNNSPFAPIQLTGGACTRKKKGKH